MMQPASYGLDGMVTTLGFDILPVCVTRPTSCWNDWPMPEGVTCVLSDRLSDALPTPSHDAELNLVRKGIDPEQTTMAER